MQDDRAVRADEGSGVRVFARWTAFILASVIAGTIVFFAIGTLFGEALDRYGGYAFGTVFALIFGTAIGAGQYLAMRRNLDPGAGWNLATLIGFLFGTIFIFGVLDAASRDTSLAEGILHALLIGGGIGTAQWLIIRNKVPSSASWIAFTLAAWILAEFLGRATTELVGPPLDILVLLFSGAALQGIGFALLIRSRWSSPEGGVNMAGP